jgi:hypothetical protein
MSRPIVLVISHALLWCALAGCAPNLTRAARVQTAANQRWRGKQVELRQSCFYGDFYDDKRKWFLSPHPFEQVTHVTERLPDLDGTPAHPGPARGIVRAGTRFTVAKVELPDLLAVASRLMTTPRRQAWVYLELTAEDARLPRYRRYWVIVLPADAKDALGVEQALAQALAPVGDVRTWLNERRPTVRVGIEHKDIVKGMSSDELVAAMGAPLRWLDDSQQGRPVRVAWYGTREAWLANATVIDVRPGRSVGEPPMTAAN